MTQENNILLLESSELLTGQDPQPDDASDSPSDEEANNPPELLDATAMFKARYSKSKKMREKSKGPRVKETKSFITDELAESPLLIDIKSSIEIFALSIRKRINFIEERLDVTEKFSQAKRESNGLRPLVPRSGSHLHFTASEEVMGTKEFETLEGLVNKSRDEFNLVVSDVCEKKSILELKEAKVQLLKTFLTKGVQLA